MTTPAAPAGDLRGYQLADWAEVAALYTGKPFKRGDLKSAVDGSGDRGDRLVEDAWSLLQARSKLLDDSWPFSLDGSRLTHDSTLSDDQRLLYSYFGLLGYSSLTADDRLLFEQAVHCVVSNRLAGAALRIGHPADGKMSTSFRTRVTLYSRMSRLRPSEVGLPPLSDDKDLGLDVVGWYPFSDRRGGEPHFLVQCATGDDWTTKTEDIKLVSLTPHLFWGATPIRIMCIPRSIIVDEQKWMRWSREAGILMDRSRLVRELGAAPLPGSIREHLAERIDALALA